MLKTIALCASLLTPALALADEAQAPSTNSVQSTDSKAGIAKSKTVKTRKNVKRGQGRIGSKQSGADTSAPAPSVTK